jgi:hypothetical protein
MAIPGPFPARGPDRRTVTDRAGAGLAMSDHGQDARATSELTLEMGSADLICRSAVRSPRKPQTYRTSLRYFADWLPKSAALGRGDMK